MIQAASPARTFWLSMHAAYRCRDAGACCTAGWPIPVERPRVASIARLRPKGDWLIPAPGSPDDVAGILATTARGACVFHGRWCAIQHAGGHSALPTACQHFPREVLIDPRGVHVTLSHYCPTAAELLFSHTGAVEIVEGPPALPEGVPEGLDAREVLPPLLTSHVLMDHPGYAAWEARMVTVLTRSDGRTPEEALATLEQDAELLREWRPGGPSLTEAVARLASSETPTPFRPSHPGTEAMVIRRFLAARAFASWYAYQGNGLAAVLGSLRLSLSVLRTRLAQLAPGLGGATNRPLKEAIRQTDLELLHLADRTELARRLDTGPA